MYKAPLVLREHSHPVSSEVLSILGHTDVYAHFTDEGAGPGRPCELPKVSQVGMAEPGLEPGSPDPH